MNHSSFGISQHIRSTSGFRGYPQIKSSGQPQQGIDIDHIDSSSFQRQVINPSTNINAIFTSLTIPQTRACESVVQWTSPKVVPKFRGYSMQMSLHDLRGSA